MKFAGGSGEGWVRIGESNRRSRPIRHSRPRWNSQAGGRCGSRNLWSREAAAHSGGLRAENEICHGLPPARFTTHTFSPQRNTVQRLLCEAVDHVCPCWGQCWEADRLCLRCGDAQAACNHCAVTFFRPLPLFAARVKRTFCAAPAADQDAADGRTWTRERNHLAMVCAISK